MTAEPAWSTGGRGGTVAVTEDLEIASATLGGAVGDLDDAARALGVAAHLGGPPPEAASLAGAAATLADELRALAAALAATARAYLEAESEARDGLTPAEALGEAARDWFGTVAWVQRWANAIGGVGTGAIPPLPPTTGLVNRATTSAALRIEAYDRVAGALARALAQAEALEPPTVGVERAREVEDAVPVVGVAGIVHRLAWVYGLGDGSVAIETVRGADGATRHLVYVPGTQDWGLWAANPADLQANLASVVGGGSDAARTVVRAMDAHGVGPHEEVLIAGHSQGGMVAVIAATALTRFRVTHVVTAGSPTGRLAVPSRIAALHLENTRDLVPGLDGRANPDRPHRVTVSHDRRRSTRADRPDASRTVAEAHAPAGYAATARLVDEGLSASTRAWTDGARPFLTGETSTVTAYRPVTG